MLINSLGVSLFLHYEINLTADVINYTLLWIFLSWLLTLHAAMSLHICNHQLVYTNSIISVH